MKTCLVPECDRRSHGNGYCGMHYQRLRKTGLTDAPMSTRPAADRFWGKVNKQGPDPHNESAQAAKYGACWVWTARLTRGGYGYFKSEGRSWYAHVFAWVLEHGEPPADGMELDHFACDRPSCVRPSHLRPVTPRENTLRAFASMGSINGSKTHCPSGHEYTLENTAWYEQKSRHGRPGLARVCRTCKRLRSRERRREKLKARA